MEAQLTHRERVLRAIENREIDRVASFFFAEPEVEQRVREDLGLADLAAILRYFDVDTIRAGLVMKENARQFPDLAAVERVEEMAALPWPGRDDVDVESSRRSAAEARSSGLCVLGGAWASIFTGPRRSMGEAKFLMAMVSDPELVSATVRLTAEAYIAMNEVYFGACGRDVDIFFFGSDFGTQRSLFISRDMFCRFFKPHMYRIVQHAKAFGVKVMYHTCGAVTDIIPDLIDCGVDVLDPVQVSAKNMDPAFLAEHFKGQIAFHGGISTQFALPFHTESQLRAEVTRTIATLGPTGYIAGPDQYMIGDIPTANVVAMYQAIHDYCPGRTGRDRRKPR